MRSGFGNARRVWIRRSRSLGIGKVSFFPATFDGEPVESWVRFQVPFRFGETAKASPELRTVMAAIGRQGYATGACREFEQPDVVQQWDDLERQIRERSTALYRPYDQIFVDGYQRGREWAASNGGVTLSRCNDVRRWAESLEAEAILAFRKLQTQMPLEARQELMPRAVPKAIPPAAND